MQLPQFLGRERRPEVSIPVPDQTDRRLAQHGAMRAIAGSAALARNQADRTLRLERTSQLEKLPPADVQQRRRLIRPMRPSLNSTSTLTRCNSRTLT